MNTPDPDPNAATTLREIRSASLYHHLLTFEDGQNRVHQDLVPKKQAALELIVAHNPLARAIAARRPLASPHPLLQNSPFNGQPVTCFAVHELLRRTRFNRDFADLSSPGVLTLDGERVSHDQLLSWYQELVPNTNLTKAYDRSFLIENPAVAPVLGGILVGGFTAMDAEPEQWPQVIGAGIVGAGVIGAILFGLNRANYGRRLTATAPWNSSLYVDTNLVLLSDHPDELHLGSRAVVPRPQVAGWKLKSKYYPLIRQLADGAYYHNLKAAAGSPV
jgi:hypothetical protein